MIFALTILRGFSYVFFSQNVLLGTTIAISLGIFSPIALLMAAIGNLVGILAAMLLGVKQSVIETGAFGFNGILIGVMVAFYVKQIPMAILLTVIASAAAALIYYLFFKNNVPALAFPFALTGWGILIFLKYFKLY
ncbi:urea transporter [Candidatus Curtissbacteria bacterium]|nr:urea transporter [Candidatus Curtissbacteria bacterium]